MTEIRRKQSFPTSPIGQAGAEWRQWRRADWLIDSIQFHKHNCYVVVIATLYGIQN